MRKRFYPGSDYVDIAGIDIYPSEYIGIGKPQERHVCRQLSRHATGRTRQDDRFV